MHITLSKTIFFHPFYSNKMNKYHTFRIRTTVADTKTTAVFAVIVRLIFSQWLVDGLVGESKIFLFILGYGDDNCCCCCCCYFLIFIYLCIGFFFHTFCTFLHRVVTGLSFYWLCFVFEPIDIT